MNLFPKLSYWTSVSSFPSPNKWKLTVTHADFWVSLLAQMVKNLPAIQKTRVQSLSGEDSLEKKMTPTLVFLPGEFHRQRSLASYSLWGRKQSDTTEQLTHTHADFHTPKGHSCLFISTADFRAKLEIVTLRRENPRCRGRHLAPFTLSIKASAAAPQTSVQAMLAPDYYSSIIFKGVYSTGPLFSLRNLILTNSRV